MTKSITKRRRTKSNQPKGKTKKQLRKEKKQKDKKERQKKESRQKKKRSKKRKTDETDETQEKPSQEIQTMFENIEDVDDKIYVGKLFAEWCGHCKNMTNDWKEMEDSLHNDAKNGQNVPIILNIESTYEDDFTSKNPSFESSGYPTIFKKKPKMPFEYYGGARRSKEFIEWAKK
jgi:thiol-disulfide isomerase/thioredoxin